MKFYKFIVNILVGWVAEPLVFFGVYVATIIKKRRVRVKKIKCDILTAWLSCWTIWLFRCKSCYNKSLILLEKNEIYLFIYLTSPTRAGSPQQLMPITVGPHYLPTLSTFPVGGNRSTRRKPTTFRRALTCTLLTWGLGPRTLLGFGLATSEVKGE